MTMMKREQTRSYARTFWSLCSACSLAAALVLSQAAAQAAEAPPAAKASNAVDVKLTEYAIDMPHTLPPGPTTFKLHNEGKKVHRFKIEGPGIDGAMSDEVSPRQTGSLDLTLQPGEYKVTCPIGSHSMKGMSLTVTVAKPAA
jgi:plastocyanin